MVYEAKDYNHLKGKLKGISDKQLEAHFGLYNGYVKKWNEIQEKLKSQDTSAANYSFGEFSELKRRQAVAFNGTFLHELYFENLGEDGKTADELNAQIEKKWGSFDNLNKDLNATAASTPGWVVLTWCNKTNELHTFVLYEHHIGLPAHQKILLALDCWEHAFMIDYGTNKADYLSAFAQNINWTAVNKRWDER